MIRSIEEIISLSSNSIQEILKKSDVEELAHLFLLIKQKEKDKIIENISSKVQKLIKDKCEEIGIENADTKYINSFLNKINEVIIYKE